jgi:hypothetical protein
MGKEGFFGTYDQAQADGPTGGLLGHLRHTRLRQNRTGTFFKS